LPSMRGESANADVLVVDSLSMTLRPKVWILPM
jgi:hypothetical protein